MLNELPKELLVVLFAMLPFFELRLAVPFGIMNGLSWQTTLLLSLLGNFLPIFPLVFWLEKVLIFLQRNPVFFRFYSWVMNKSHGKKHLVEAYGRMGLLLFVAVPLPGSGVYTASVIGLLLGLRRRDRLLALTGGMLIAGILVTLGSLGIVTIFENPLLIFVGIVTGVFIYRKWQKRKKI